MGKTKREREYKNLRLEVKTLDDTLGTFSGYLAVFGNIDDGDDVICPGAFSKTLAESKAWAKKHEKKFILPILFMHNREAPIGGFTEMKEDEHGLYVEGMLDISTNEAGIPNNAEATKVYSGMKMGFIDEMSVGFYTIKRDFKDGVRYLREIAAFEGSCVVSNLAMNPQALITTVKSEVSPMDNKQALDFQSFYRVARTARKRGKKDFSSTYAQAQAMDCLIDWYDLTSSLKQAMTEIIMESADPQADAMTSLAQFQTACMAWVADCQEHNLAGYLTEQQSSLDYYYTRPEGEGEVKSGASLSQKNRDTISTAVEGLKAHTQSLQDLLDAYNVSNNNSNKTAREPEQSTQDAQDQPEQSTEEEQKTSEPEEDWYAKLLSEAKALVGK